MIGDWQSAAVLSSFTSVFSGADERMAGRMIPACDIRDVRSARRKVKPATERMKLPQNATSFDSSSDVHVVMAWCLSLRDDLNDREKSFLASATSARKGRWPVQLVRDIFLLLDGYKCRFEDGVMRRAERARVLDLPKQHELYLSGDLRDLSQVQITRNHAQNLLVMVQLQLANMRAVA